MNDTVSRNKKISYRWVIVSLLFFATTNNYFNRIVLSVVIPEIKSDLDISDIQYSYVLSVFQFAYMFGMLAAGKFIDWAGTKLGYLLSIVAWSCAACLHAISGSAWSLGTWRGLLGMSEAGNFPAAIKSVAEWFPPEERAFATSLFNSGPHIAVIFGAPVVAFLTMQTGWRGAFLFVGATGFLLAIIWPFLYKHRPTEKTQDESSLKQSTQVPWRILLRHRETYGFMLGKFLTDPVWWFYIFWLPNYLNTQRGFDLKKIAVAVPLTYIIAILIGIAAGWIPGLLIRHGWTVKKARKATMCACAMCLPFTAFAVTAENVWVTVLLIALACGAHSGWSNNIFTVVSDNFPVKTVASVTGLGGFAGAVGGLLFSTVLVGYIVTYLGYVPIFVLMGVLHPLAMVCIHVLIRRDAVIEV